VASECYLALDKGPINSPFHLLAVPIDHLSCTLDLKDSTFAELERYMGAVASCFASQGLDLVMFERYLKLKGREGGNHCHWNLVGVAKDQNVGPKLKEALSEGSGFAFREMKTKLNREDLREIVGDMEYVLVTLPDGSSLVHPIMRGERVPFNLVREALAKSMGCPERADWKQCRQTDDQEANAVAKFKAIFGQFDLM